jgi:hypothetical protein
VVRSICVCRRASPRLLRCSSVDMLSYCCPGDESGDSTSRLEQCVKGSISLTLVLLLHAGLMPCSHGCFLLQLFGMAAILFGIVLGFDSLDHVSSRSACLLRLCSQSVTQLCLAVLVLRSGGQEGALLAYILFGFGFIVSLISGLGLFGVRQGSQEFLRVVSCYLLCSAA